MVWIISLIQLEFAFILGRNSHKNFRKKIVIILALKSLAGKPVPCFSRAEGKESMQVKHEVIMYINTFFLGNVTFPALVTKDAFWRR